MVASDIYPAVRLYLEESELHKCVKAFDKETTTEDGEPPKPKKALRALTLVAASQAWVDAQQLAKPRTVEAADVRPALRRFLTEAGLQKSLKMFGKETAGEEPANPKKAKALADLELTAACKLWLEARPLAVEENAEKPKKKKRKAEEKEEEEAAVAKTEEVAEDGPPKKKKKKQQAEPDAVEVSEVGAGKKQKEEKNRTKIAGTPFQRIDCEKWTKTIKDERLKNNTHAAKAEYGEDAGDCWGDKSAEDLGKVKGKGFRKEMAKKKRASWRGGGEINQGVNSIAFSDSEEE